MVCSHLQKSRLICFMDTEIATEGKKKKKHFTKPGSACCLFWWWKSLFFLAQFPNIWALCESNKSITRRFIFLHFANNSFESIWGNAPAGKQNVFCCKYFLFSVLQFSLWVSHALLWLHIPFLCHYSRSWWSVNKSLCWDWWYYSKR